MHVAAVSQMAQLEGENLAIKSYKSTIDGLEIDKKNLQQQLKDMERTLHDVTSVVKTAESQSTGARGGAAPSLCILKELNM